MSTEEPAWKAELRENLDEEFISSGAEIFDLVVPYIQTAEQRGRREALTEAAEKILAGRMARYDRDTAVKAGLNGPLAVLAYGQAVIAEALREDSP